MGNRRQGWLLHLHDVHLRPAHRLCRHRSDLHRPQESECKGGGDSIDEIDPAKLEQFLLAVNFFSSKNSCSIICSPFLFQQIELITKSTTSPSFSSSSCGKAFIGKIPDVCCRNIFIAGSKRHFAHVVIFFPGLCS